METKKKRTNLQRKRSLKKKFPGVVLFGWAKSEHYQDDTPAVRSLYLIVQTSQEKVDSIIGSIRKYHESLIEEGELFSKDLMAELRQGYPGYSFSFYSCDSVKVPRASFPSNVFHGLVKGDGKLALKNGGSLQKYALGKIRDYLS